MSKEVPKRFAQPAKGFTVDTEPDDVKAARILAMFRWAAKTGHWGWGMTIGDAKFMIIRYRPRPDGPHEPNADLSGPEL